MNHAKHVSVAGTFIIGGKEARLTCCGQGMLSSSYVQQFCVSSRLYDKELCRPNV